MRDLRDKSFTDRIGAAAKAKQAQLEKARALAAASREGLADRQAARATINADREKRAEARKAEKLAHAEIKAKERAEAEKARIANEAAEKLAREAKLKEEAARKIALSVANSPLVKTAIAGGDANWGRIVMAVGKAGEAADRDKLKIAFGEQVVAEKGARAAKYNEAAATKAASGREVEITIDVGIGKGKSWVWTCDLTHGYIDINGSYRS